MRVYYEDTDAGGVVFYANYLKFMERARTEWLRSLGVEQDVLLERGIAFMVRSVAVDYLAPAKFNESLLISCELVQQKRVSMVFVQKVQSACKTKTYVTSSVTIACVDLSCGKPTAIPQSIIKVLPSVG